MGLEGHNEFCSGCGNVELSMAVLVEVSREMALLLWNTRETSAAYVFLESRA